MKKTRKKRRTVDSIPPSKVERLIGFIRRYGRVKLSFYEVTDRKKVVDRERILYKSGASVVRYAYYGVRGKVKKSRYQQSCFVYVKTRSIRSTIQQMIKHDRRWLRAHPTVHYGKDLKKKVVL